MLRVLVFTKSITQKFDFFVKLPIDRLLYSFRLTMYICGRRKLVEWKKLYRSIPCLIPIPEIWCGTSF